MAAYPANSKMNVKSKILVDCDNPFWIKPNVRTTMVQDNGTSTPVEIDFPAQRFENQNGASFVEYDQDALGRHVKKQVWFFDKSFPIEWEYARDKVEGNSSQPGDFTSFKTTNHTMGITRSYPLNLNEVYESTIYLGCHHAKGKSRNNDIVEAIWIPFEANVFGVQRYGDREVAGKVITYWENCQPETCLLLPQLLASQTPDGRCNALRDLLKAIIFTQGIALSDPNIVIEAKNMFAIEPDDDLENEFDGIAVWEEVNFQDENGVLVTQSLMAVREWGSFISNASNNFFELVNIPSGCGPNWAEGDEGINGQGGERSFISSF